MPRRKKVLEEEVGNGLLKWTKDRVLPEPSPEPSVDIDSNDQVFINQFVVDIQDFAYNTVESFFDTSNAVKLMNDIKNREPEIQYKLLQFANRYTDTVSRFNDKFIAIYNKDPSLFYYTIRCCERHLFTSYNFSVISRLFSMLLGRDYILNRIPSTLPAIYTRWR